MLVPMFTYGILKYPSNIKNEGGVNIVTNAKVKGHRMYTYRGSFPITKRVEENEAVVYGTYFEIEEAVVLDSYDTTEGYFPNGPKNRNMYNREIVTVILPDGTEKQANMYIANKEMFNEWFHPDIEIVTGNYDDKLTHTRFLLQQV